MKVSYHTWVKDTKSGTIFWVCHPLYDQYETPEEYGRVLLKRYMKNPVYTYKGKMYVSSTFFKGRYYNTSTILEKLKSGRLVVVTDF